MPTRHTRTSRGIEASALFRGDGRALKTSKVAHLVLVAIHGNPTNAEVLTEEVLALRVIVINIAMDALPLASMRSSVEMDYFTVQKRGGFHIKQ